MNFVNVYLKIPGHKHFSTYLQDLQYEFRNENVDVDDDDDSLYIILSIFNNFLKIYQMYLHFNGFQNKMHKLFFFVLKNLYLKGILNKIIQNNLVSDKQAVLKALLSKRFS